GVDVVDGIGHDEVDVRLERSHVLSQAERRLDHLTELAVGERRNTAVFKRVFVPEEIRLVARPADAKGVGKIIELAGRIDHQIHAGPDLFPNTQNVRNFALDWSVSPTVDLEGRVAKLTALNREVGVRVGPVQTVVVVAVGCASVGGK